MLKPNAILPEPNDPSYDCNMNHGEPMEYSHYLSYSQNINEPGPSTSNHAASVEEMTSELFAEPSSPGGTYYLNRDPGIPMISLLPDGNDLPLWSNMLSASPPIGDSRNTESCHSLLEPSNQI